MSSYQVDSDAVLATTSSVTATTGRIAAEVAALYAQLVDLQSTWSGAASSAFQAVAADWKATQARVEANLEAINTALATAGRQYAEIEQSNTRLFL
ncbi:WXG100 family type VII secretion target [Herbiconiux sp. SYSU D00978]|uniref:WXG100 family type VII secretion target n=1 Tax=Herbiconiux sp. SYSU D00978 TaxID=2812562 RepID=UPI001A95B406|nr:WXG100 family type VII secretion target [Herbiconiux sp. SYSU D00978]